MIAWFSHGRGRRWREQITRVVGYVVARRELRDCDVGSRVCATGRVRVERSGARIVIGRSVVFVGGLEPTRLIGSPEGNIVIGEASVINYGTRIAAIGADVILGRRCMLGSGVRLMAAPHAPIVIEDDVWIAHGAVVEGGVRIGAGSVVAAGAVVEKSIPPGSLAIGNPARAMSLELLSGSRAA